MDGPLERDTDPKGRKQSGLTRPGTITAPLLDSTDSCTSRLTSDLSVCQVGREFKVRSSQIALYRCESITFNYVNLLLFYAKFARTAATLAMDPPVLSRGRRKTR